MYKRDIYLDIDDELNNYIKSVELDSDSRVWHFHLTVDYEPLDLTGKSVHFRAEKPDKTNILNDCKIVDAEKGVVEVKLTRQVNAIPGCVKCLLKIIGDEGFVLKTKTFVVDVSKTLSDDAIVSSDEFGALEAALGKVQDIDNRFAQTNAQLSQIPSAIQLGAKGDGITDDSEVLADKNLKKVFIEDKTFVVDTEKIIGQDGKFTGFGRIKLINRRGNPTESVIYNTEFAGDEMYDCMYLASQAKSNVDKHLYCGYLNDVYSFTGDRITINPHGAVSLIDGAICPENFTICFGKSKLFGYKNGEWIELSSQLCREGALYKANWVDQSTINVDDRKVDKGTHIEISLTRDLMLKDGIERLYHFFTGSYTISEYERNTDYKYFITYVECWIKEKEFEDRFIFGTSADMRCKHYEGISHSDYIHELGQGRRLTLKSYKKRGYFCSVPSELYKEIVINSQLMVVDTPKYIQHEHILMLPPSFSTETKLCKFATFKPRGSVIVELSVTNRSDTDIRYGKMSVIMNRDNQKIDIKVLNHVNLVANSIMCKFENGGFNLYLNSASMLEFCCICVTMKVTSYRPYEVDIPSLFKTTDFDNIYSQENFNKYFLTIPTEGMVGNSI